MQGLSVLGLGNVLRNLRVLNPLFFYRQAYSGGDDAGFNLSELGGFSTLQV